MTQDLKEILIRILSIPIGLIIAIVVLRLKRLSLKEHFGLTVPSKREALVWLLGFIPIIALNELYYYSLGLNEGRIWEYAPEVMIVRAVGIIILAPITEELLFRGLIFKVIADRRPGPLGAVVITAILFAAVHIQYGIADLVTIFIDALYWGWVRYKTGTTMLPVVMHIAANTIAVIEAIWINRLIG
jgi:hypothetical protein